MVPHHQAALEMARIAQRRAEHAEPTQMAAAVLRGQPGEIAWITQWRQWYGAA